MNEDGKTLRVLLIDDAECSVRQVEEYFEEWDYGDFRLELETSGDFQGGLDRLERERFDLLVLDVFKGSAELEDEAGRRVFESIRARRFIPVIFYTAVSVRVQDLENAVVRVVSRGDGLGALEDELKLQIDNGLIPINRELNAHFERTIREYLWDYLPQHWDELTGTKEWKATLAYLLSRRIAASLDLEGADELANRLIGTDGVEHGREARVHPLYFYIVPSETASYRTGDILCQEELISYWVVLTPSCDFLTRRNRARHAEHVLLAKGVLLEECEEYKDWIGGGSPTQLKRLLATPAGRPKDRQEGRFFFLPGVLEIPDMVIDFQQIDTVPFTVLEGYRKLGSLDSPFAESVVSHYVQFVGRLGTPDLNTEGVVARLEQNRVNSQPDDDSGC